MRTPQIFTDASGQRRRWAVGVFVALLLVAIVCGSAFLFSFLEVPVHAPVAGLFGARPANQTRPAVMISSRRAPVSAALLERYHKESLQALEQLDANAAKPKSAAESLDK